MLHVGSERLLSRCISNPAGADLHCRPWGEYMLLEMTCRGQEN